MPAARRKVGSEVDTSRDNVEYSLAVGVRVAGPSRMRGAVEAGRVGSESDVAGAIVVYEEPGSVGASRGAES